MRWLFEPRDRQRSPDQRTDRQTAFTYDVSARRDCRWPEARQAGCRRDRRAKPSPVRVPVEDRVSESKQEKAPWWADLGKEGAPTAAEIEKLAREYVDRKAKVLEAMLAQRKAAADMDPLHEKCTELVKQFGSAHATKSKLLHGLDWEIMGTFGASTSTDAAAVERLRSKLEETKQTRLLKRLFDKTVRWTLKPTARTEILRPDVDDEIRGLFAVCEVTKDRAPSIEVRPKS